MGYEIRGLDRLQTKVSKLSSIIKDAVVDATQELTDLAQEYAVQNVQSNFKHPTGELAGSIRTEVSEKADGKISGRVFTDKKQGVFTEFGTGPVGQASTKDLPPGINPIYTQTRWFFPVDSVDRDLHTLYGMTIVEIQGTEFYMTRGQPARPWLYPALKEASEFTEDIYQEHVSKRLREGLK